MIEEAKSMALVRSMSGLDFFPTEKPALKALSEAIQTANSQQIAEKAVSEWLAECTQRPTPADMRRIISGLNTQAAEGRRKCERCGGTGSRTGYFLVSYRNNSFVVESKEFLYHTPECGGPADAGEQALRFAERLDALNTKQTIVTAARRCDCIPERRD